ncbi:prohead protease/major capsid protein fusion protein [Xanthobacter sp. DSM 14520]|uniref:prohead protease/major capsid protein fusion protein n=1 Tax=Xanthobacter autotrophicus (strain ATCC BAA-1158 / Py2) TaxID=78245 RepID=UPI00372A4389
MTLPLITRRAPLAATSWNPEERTLEVVFSSGAPVERFDARGAFVERLDLSQDWTPFEGAPVLNAHQRGDVADVLGSVVKAWTVSSTEARAIIRLSRRPDVEPILQDILDGHLRQVSVGYAVAEWSETTAGGVRTKIATKWTPLELSIVPVAADSGATIREVSMPESFTIESQPQTLPAAAERAQINAEIRSIARVTGLDQSFIDQQIDGGATVEQARAAAFEAMRTRSAPAGSIRAQQGATLDDPHVRAQAMGEAILSRISPSHEPSGPARNFVGLTVPELARESLRAAGIQTTGLGAATVIQRALHSTSDFALALGDAVGRVLRSSYEAAPSGLRQVARQVTHTDFRARSYISMSQFSPLEKVGEHGEFARGTIEEGGESFKLDTFGKVFSISRQALVNDDLGAFADVPRKLGIAAAQFEAGQLAVLVATNPLMSDGKALFHADHGNLGTASELTTDGGTWPAWGALTVARQSMRAQKDESGQLIAVVPKFLVVGPALESDAESLLAQITPANAGDANPFAGKLTIVVEPRITGKQWYVVADPAVSDGLVYAHLAGEAGPQIESRTGFDVDGVETRVRLDFGCGFIDWRSWFKNPGAA